MTEDQYRSWIESELTRQFRPVHAPDTLWQSIHEQRRPLRTRSRITAAVWIPALTLLALSVGLSARLTTTPINAADLRSLSATAGAPDRIEFRSGDPNQIRAWVKERSGIDISFPEKLPATGENVSLVGARLVRLKGTPLAEVTCRVGQHFVSMLVANRPVRSGAGRKLRHEDLRIESAADMRLISWNMGAERYMMALTDTYDFHKACLLCHADPPGL
jgi:hypothetical protein